MEITNATGAAATTTGWLHTAESFVIFRRRRHCRASIYRYTGISRVYYHIDYISVTYTRRELYSRERERERERERDQQYFFCNKKRVNKKQSNALL